MFVRCAAGSTGEKRNMCKRPRIIANSSVKKAKHIKLDEDEKMT